MKCQALFSLTNTQQISKFRLLLSSAVVVINTLWINVTGPYVNKICGGLFCYDNSVSSKLSKVSEQQVLLGYMRKLSRKFAVFACLEWSSSFLWEINIHGSFSAIFYKADNSCGFLFAFQHTKSLLKIDLLY